MTILLDDVLVALEETAAESKPERCALLMSVHNLLVRQFDEDVRLKIAIEKGGTFAERVAREPLLHPAVEIDNREDPEG